MQANPGGAAAFHTVPLNFQARGSPVGFGLIRVWVKIDFIAGEDLPPPRTAAPDTNLIGHCGAPEAQVRPRARKSPPPPCPHTPSEAPASAHCELDRRAQVCLSHGQAGSRGSADPLEACGAEYHVGIVDGQVCSALPLATPCRPRAAAPATQSDRADPPRSTAAAPVHRIFCMPVELKARRRLSAFVLFRRVQIVASERVRRVRLCECGVRSFGVRREPLCVLLVVAHLRVGE